MNTKKTTHNDGYEYTGKHVYTVVLRYVASELHTVAADSPQEAEDLAWGFSDGAYERVRNYKPIIRRLK